MKREDYRDPHSASTERLSALPGDMPDLLAELNALRQQAMRDGVLSRKVKELTALGMSVVARCNTSTAYHLHNALAAGATHEEVAEILGVSMTIAGEAVALQGLKALRALEQESGGDGSA